MKKIFIVLILSLALVSCYEDYVKDFDYTAVYFPNPVDVRTVVAGEGLRVNLGAALGGVMENKFDRNVNFTINNNLVTAALLTQMKGSTYAFIKNAVEGVTELKPLPTNYYTLSDNSKIVIKKGWHSGTVTLKVDSTIFLSDPKTIKATYILPLYISTADADTILENNRSLKVGIKYEHMLFGNYLHGGVTIAKNGSGVPIDTITYITSRSQGDTKIWQLTTVSPNSVATNGYSDKTSTSKNELVLTLNGTNITVTTADGASNTYEANGTNTYNGAKLLQNRKILLNYKYTVDTVTYYCQDTLTFRNRIRDGVNEWQDENPSHYKN
ncbi:MAG: DUF1735 domain-containing protein [Bacteroidales bacterium]|nr:DUF1735 domain-containing protein [Bacteroidales bacterium]